MNDEIKELLERAGKQFAYPETPDVAGRVSRQASHGYRLRRSFLAVSILIVFLLVCGISSTVTPVRAAILDFLQLGSIQINNGASDIPSPETLPSEPIFSLLQSLDGETTLERAEEGLERKILSPNMSRSIFPPDKVFFQDLGGPAAILVWFSDQGQNHIERSLIVLGSEAFIGKSAPNSVTHTEMWGQDALWLTGDHRLFFLVEGVETSVLVSGNVLIWEYDGLTYRLETSSNLAAALQLARSIYH